MVTVRGSGFGAVGSSGATCHLESVGAIGPLSHSTPDWGYKGPSLETAPAIVKSLTGASIVSSLVGWP